MKIIQQQFSITYHYPVFFTRHLFDKENSCLNSFLQTFIPEKIKKKILWIADEGLIKFHPQLLHNITSYFDGNEAVISMPEVLIIPGGEIAKNDEKYFYRIIDTIEKNKIDRHSYVAAIGGGAVLDLAGYAAAVAHRGIKHIRIPTTVLSQNDSGIGVKNGINYCNKKNFIGTFAPPLAVFNDATFLTTLNERDWRGGIAEAIKVALIKEANFFYWIEDHIGELNNRNLDVMEELIFHCADLHLQHIASGDAFENGSSRPLDFGHWSAHKLEALTNFNLHHGEAVAIGMALDAVYAFLLGWLPEEEMTRIISLLKKSGFVLYVPELEKKELLDGLQEFREHLGGRLTILQLKKIGHGENVHEMNIDLIRQAIEKLKEYNFPQSR